MQSKSKDCVLIGEVAKIGSIAHTLAEYGRMGKLVHCPKETVDSEETLVKSIESSKKFNDPHLVALVRSSGCKLICTRDKNSHKYLTMIKLYRSSLERPKLYTQAGNSNLLRDSNIVACCK
jgi:hypothetical protein